MLKMMPPGLLVIFALVANSQVLATELPAFSIDKVTAIPDLMQSHVEAGLPDGGKVYCGPVAVSNSLVWLSKNGFEKLVASSVDDPRSQGALALLISSPPYMRTTLLSGTDTQKFISGIEKYVQAAGLPFQLAYQGWEEAPSKYSRGSDLPQLDFIKSGVLGPSAAWLKIGWYRYDVVRRDVYRRFAAHWVTVVGYGKNEKGIDDPNVLIVHDPAPRSGVLASHDYVEVSLLERGTLELWRDGPRRAAAGFYKLAGGLKIKEGADLGILDGAVVLNMGSGSKTRPKN
jgi:hypothetical protein